jgi:hypothetical protein
MAAALAPTECTRLMTPVSIVFDPDDTIDCMRLVAGLADRTLGRVVCHPTPVDPGGSWLAVDLLVALGKRLDAPWLESVGRRAWPLAQLWLRAEEVQDLYVLRAHLLGTRALGRLVELQRACGLQLWLIVHRPALRATQQRLLDAAGWRGLPLEALRRRWRPAARNTDANHQVEAHPDRFPAVPGADFPVFRAACRRLLDPDSFAQVDRCYCDALRQILKWLAQRHANLRNLERLHSQTHRQGWRWAEADDAYRRERSHTLALAWDHFTNEVANRLHALTATSRSSAETLVRLRGAQAAFLRYGLLLQLNPAMLATFDTQHGRPVLDQPVAARLRGCCTPLHTAAAALALLTGAHPEELVRLRVGDVTHNGGAVRLAGQPYTVPEYARSLVRALLLQRGQQQATPDAPLLAGYRGRHATSDTVRRTLDQVAVQAGVTIPSLRSFERPARPAAWLVEHGLSLARPLAAPPHFAV